MKEILIVGGTGLIGRALTDFLLKHKNRITILTRQPELIHEGKGYLQYINKISDKDFDYDIIINLAGETIAQRWDESAKKRILDSRINSTKEIIQAIKDSNNKPELFINSSAIGFYGADDEEEFHEDSKPKNQNIFSQNLCQQIENESKKVGRETRLVILRTAVVISREGGFLKKMLLPFKFGLGGKIGSGKQYISWIHIDDLVNCINYIITTPQLSGAINLSAPNPTTNHDFAKNLAKKLHRPCFFHMPEFIARLLFGKMGEELILSGQKVTPKKLIESGYTFKYQKIETAI